MRDVGAIVLCGGMSRRMGRPKALLPFGDGEVLLQRVVRLVGEVASPVVVVATPGQQLPPLPSSVILARDPIPGRGPLQGIAAGLAALPSDSRYAYAMATDAPFLQAEWVRLLRRRIGEADLAIPFAGGYPHPLSALYRRAGVTGPIADLLAADRLRPSDLVEAVHAVVLTEDELRPADPALMTLRNLNTIAEYDDALVILQGSGRLD